MSYEIRQAGTNQCNGSGYLPNKLARKLKISGETLRKYAIAAGIARPLRGQRNFKYSVEDVQKLCDYMEANASSVDVEELKAEIPTQDESRIEQACEEGQEVFTEESITETEEEIIVETKRIIKKKIDPDLGEEFEEEEEIEEEEFEEEEEEVATNEELNYYRLEAGRFRDFVSYGLKSFAHEGVT